MNQIYQRLCGDTRLRLLPIYGIGCLVFYGTPGLRLHKISELGYKKYLTDAFIFIKKYVDISSIKYKFCLTIHGFWQRYGEENWDIYDPVTINQVSKPYLLLLLPTIKWTLTLRFLIQHLTKIYTCLPLKVLIYGKINFYC